MKLEIEVIVVPSGHNMLERLGGAERAFRSIPPQVLVRWSPGSFSDGVERQLRAALRAPRGCITVGQFPSEAPTAASALGTCDQVRIVHELLSQ